MNNRELYRETFSKVQTSSINSMEEIMNNKKPVRYNKKPLITFVMMIMLVLGTVSVNAATGGAVSEYFHNLIGSENGTAKITWENDSNEYCEIEINLHDEQVGIYDEKNEMVKDLTISEADDIHFDKDNQSCTLDGKTYKVLLVVAVNEVNQDTDIQVRLYSPDDYETAIKSFEPETEIGNKDGVKIYMPYIQIDDVK